MTIYSIYSIFLVAFVFYTMAIWGHRCYSGFRVWIIPVFGAGLTFDAVGTILCFWRWGWSLSVHEVFVSVALLIMGLHFLWTLRAINSARHNRLFTKWSTWVWALWSFVFLSLAIPHMF